LANYGKHETEFEALGVKVIAASVDPLSIAEGYSSELELGFPLGYGLDKKAISAATGACFGYIGAFKGVPLGELPSGV
jgi:hypothetical protein